MSDVSSIHPVDEKLPVGRLTTLGIQHVLVMYGGAIDRHVVSLVHISSGSHRRF